MEKLSIIVPVMNGEATIRTCLDSLVNQTLQNIEIIVINDGSTDKTEEIVKSYEDERIRLISKENEGWGKAINQGIDLATGDYVGVLESDDRADLRAFEILYSNKGEYDVIKAGWYDSYASGARGRRLPVCREIIPEQEDIRVLSLMWEVQGSIWSGIYRKEFLDKNNIRCLETPGASYQDIAFSAKLWTYAKKVLFLPDLLFFYTIDNPNQSTKDMKKVFCVKEEFNEIEKICPEKYYPILAKIRYNIYRWNYMRLNSEGRALFIDTLKEDFKKDFKYADERLFTLSQWTDYTSMIIDEQEDTMVVIGIPVYHSRETLPRALDSLVAQTKKMFIVAIVNDADGEDYSDIIEEYRGRGLKITYLVQEENKGPGSARQRVIDTFKMCEYVMFLDSDDMYTPIAVEIMTRTIQQKNLNIVMGNSTQLKTGAPATRADVSQTSITWVWNKIYRRAYLVENNIRFDETLPVEEDVEFSLSAWHGTDKKERIDQDIYYWCDNQNSLTRKLGKTEFDKKYIACFVRAQCRGLRKIYEITGTIDQTLLTMTLNLLYKQIQTALALGATEDDFIDELKSLKELELIQNWKEDFMAWCLIMEKCPIGTITKERDIIFFKERFVDWINRVFYE